VSLGVQSFVDQEAQAVGRLHKRAIVLEEIARLRQAGVANINIDLIAGLPHQTAESWTFSLSETIATGVPHVSVYMLEVDEDSRLGRELIAGGTRYHAHFVPDEEATSDFYLQACDSLNAAGIRQYEISNFARADGESRHNLKYWTRQPYIGFGVDAHSMLFADDASEIKATRFSAPDSLDTYMSRGSSAVTPVSEHGALEESFFLGLRLNQGVDLERLRARFSRESIDACELAIAECVREGLLEKRGTSICLTARGRLLSNEVFGKFLTDEKAAGVESV
jgi:oxygen-independent coproporphyrinogen-3 oxidase